MEIVLVLLIALVVFGPKKLPELGRSVGRGMREFKGSLSGEEEAEAAKKPALEENPTRAETTRV